jgi:hypothetical protein
MVVHGSAAGVSPDGRLAGQTQAMFRHQLSDLAVERRIVTLDLRGHGRSAKPHFGYRIARFSRDVSPRCRGWAPSNRRRAARSSTSSPSSASARACTALRGSRCATASCAACSAARAGCPGVRARRAGHRPPLRRSARALRPLRAGLARRPPAHRRPDARARVRRQPRRPVLTGLHRRADPRREPARLRSRRRQLALPVLENPAAFNAVVEDFLDRE